MHLWKVHSQSTCKLCRSKEYFILLAFLTTNNAAIFDQLTMCAQRKFIAQALISTFTHRNVET